MAQGTERPYHLVFYRKKDLDEFMAIGDISVLAIGYDEGPTQPHDHVLFITKKRPCDIIKAIRRRTGCDYQIPKESHKAKGKDYTLCKNRSSGKECPNFYCRLRIWNAGPILSDYHTANIFKYIVKKPESRYHPDYETLVQQICELGDVEDPQFSYEEPRSDSDSEEDQD